MTEQTAKSQKPAMRGIILTITESGQVASQIMGELNEAEFLGLGTYLSNVLMKDGIMALSRTQMAEIDALQKLIQALEEMRGEKESESCGTESCSDCSPSSDSGQSSENSQEESKD